MQPETTATAVASGGAMQAAVGLVSLVIMVVLIASWWRIFTKAGKPGWPALIPFYQFVVMLQVCRKPTWWWLPLSSFFAALWSFPFVVKAVPALAGYTWIPFLFLPFTAVPWTHLAKALASVYGKSVKFSMGIFWLPWVFCPILGFGSATYQASTDKPAA